jgi:hypothetical protein
VTVAVHDVSVEFRAYVRATNAEETCTENTGAHSANSSDIIIIIIIIAPTSCKFIHQLTGCGAIHLCILRRYVWFVT